MDKLLIIMKLNWNVSVLFKTLSCLVSLVLMGSLFGHQISVSVFTSVGI